MIHFNDSIFGQGTCVVQVLSQVYLKHTEDHRTLFSCLDPLSSRLSAFYLNCLSLLSALCSRHGSLPDDFSCKNLYNLLLELPSASPHS